MVFLAQSAGGGGGNGAMNITGNITASPSGNAGNLGVGIGGFGGVVEPRVSSLIR